MTTETNHSSTLGNVAEELVKILTPCCQRIFPIPPLPRKTPGPIELRILIIPKTESASEQNGLFQNVLEVDPLEEKLKLFQNPISVTKDHYSFAFDGMVYHFRLIRSTEEAWFANLVHASSYRDVYLSIATAAKNRGWKWAPSKGGFEDPRTGAIRFVKSEDEVFAMVGLPYTPPERRNRCPVFPTIRPTFRLPLAGDEMRVWVRSVPWTDTACGGELHQYTCRAVEADQMFVRVAEFIREYGYDGTYLRKRWRYLDLDDMFYFTWGASMETTSLMNRKKLEQPETPWAKNPIPWSSKSKSIKPYYSPTR